MGNSRERYGASVFIHHCQIEVQMIEEVGLSYDHWYKVQKAVMDKLIMEDKNRIEVFGGADFSSAEVLGPERNSIFCTFYSVTYTFCPEHEIIYIYISALNHS